MKKLLLIAFTTVLFGCNGCLEEAIPPPEGQGYGECEGDCENGYGKWTFTSKEYKGDTKEGNWKNRTLNGQGTYTFANGDKYVGEYKDDKMHGQGTYTWQDPWEQYVGEFKDDMMHGQGTYTEANGTVTKGLWIDNEFLGE